MRARVGVTTGPVFCGVIGSLNRHEYTVMGDTVNLSARLMSEARDSGWKERTAVVGDELAGADLALLSHHCPRLDSLPVLRTLY